MFFLYSLIGFVIIISLCVFVHEFGHYIIAKKNGVKIDEFSIGFGRSLFEKEDKSGTIWKVCDIPFGGYVKMFGDSDLSSKENEDIEKLNEHEKSIAFCFKSNIVKIFIALGGPLFNYLFTILILTFLYFFVGHQSLDTIITKIDDRCKITKSNLQINDRIIKINDTAINKIDDISFSMKAVKKNTIDISLERYINGKKDIITIKNFQLCEIKDKNYKKPVIGVFHGKKIFQKKTFINSFVTSVKQAVFMTGKTIESLKNIFKAGTGGLKQFSGPISIASISGKAFASGCYDFFFLLAIISMQLGFFNLLPIPGLDGGHIFIYLVESIFRIKIPSNMYNLIMYTGFGILISLMAFTTYNDLLRVFIKK